jgi:hypothetical protein
MKIKNKNKSKDGTKHVCDFCGKDVEHIWSGQGIDGQYCFEHFRLAHDNVEEFDEWYERFKPQETDNGDS